ncbi:hypothetical protein I8748_19980 [Nostoc sp. CENA67]|uniref:Uncharacterized protein n=1 Tax=Amazonocrinis nigriterrae CENA67 TaxID=2794033 RepID=A0A8J7HR30_9NOST|nr:hypothetical protein [Amazonocrinis nigriterrae]MBH8564433.1 hypothetical protein [Amazonocrinis nigriterrae CENA67]
MKIATPLNFTHIVGSIFLPKNQPATSSKSDTSINLTNHSTNINYLKSFDTAVVAYHMMGLGDFE